MGPNGEMGGEDDWKREGHFGRIRMFKEFYAWILKLHTGFPLKR